MSNSQLTSAPKTHVDARKFLGNINKRGFAGQIRLVEGKLQKLAEETDSKLRLVAHFGDSIYFEDVASNEYYQADINSKNRALSLDNIQSVVIEDKEKAKVFDEACDNLIDSIEESLQSGDSSKAEQVFGRIATGYCTPRVIPECGRVRTRDGSIHSIKVSDALIPEESRPAVAEALKEAIKSSQVVIKEGSISIGEESIDLPINETTRRVSIARNMRTVAESAYSSDNFNRLAKTVAGHVSNDNMKDAVGILKSFLSEEQEFTLLDKQGVYTLIENTLYRQGIFNYHAIRNTALLFWETNCHLNKADIIKEWSTAAAKCRNKQLSENVEILKSAAGKSPVVFSDAMDKFNQSIFNEDHSTRTVKARSYLNMLKMLNNVVTGSDADQAVKGTVDDLVMRLESDLNNVDDATLFEVEDLLATVSADLINDTSTLSDFNTIPEPFSADTFGTEEDLGDFEGDMGGGNDLAGGFGGDLGGDVGDVDVEAEVDVDNAAAEDEEEEELQLDDIINKAKPVSEMKEDDIKVVLEALKGMKPESVEVDGEFKKMLKKGLTESQATFLRKVMDHSKTVNNELYESLTSFYYDLVIAEDKGEEEQQQDSYNFGGNGDIDINEDYAGIEEKKDPAPNEGGKDEAGKKGAEERGDEAAGADDGVEEDIEKGEAVEEGHKKNLEGHKEGDRDGDYDDNLEDDSVDESIAVVSADNDEQLLSMIDKVLGSQDDEGEEDDDENGEVIADGEDEDPHAAALGRKDDDEQDTAGPEDHEDPHAVALANKGDDSEWSDEADPDQDGTPIWKDEDDQRMEDKDQEGDEIQEDNDVTDPTHADYDSDKAAEKHGDGSQINSKPKFSDKDYDGTSGANTGKNKPGSGHPNTSK